MRFLLGQGRYADDIRLPGECHGVTVLSPHAHALVKRLDVSKAMSAPGVLCVLAGADAVADQLGALTAHLMLEDFGAPKGHRTFQPLLVTDKVRCVGDRVAFVVAETLAAARDAADLIAVDYEALPAAGTRVARRAFRIDPLCSRRHGSGGDRARHLRGAQHGGRRQCPQSCSRQDRPNGSHTCEVEVDPETGVVTIDRYPAPSARATKGHQRRDRCVASARRRTDRHACDAATGMGNDPAGKSQTGNASVTRLTGDQVGLSQRNVFGPKIRTGK